MIPSASLALCMSSLTQESRYAAFGWFAVWIMGGFTYFVMLGIEINNLRTPELLAAQKWSPVSLYHALGQVQSWIFGFATFDQIKYAAATLVAITIVSTLILFRRISAPMRA